MFCFHKDIPKKNLGKGVTVQEWGNGEKMTALHWDLDDGAHIPLHDHPHEQFGYVIRGGFRMKIGEEEKQLSSGDAYFIPPNIAHEFFAIGQTEAIDIFSPVRSDLPWHKEKE